MRFIQDVERDRFDRFVKSHPTKSHYMQSPAFGEFCAVQKKDIPHLVGMENDEGELVAAALLLERKPSFLPAYMYCPRGYVLDFSDYKLLAAFTAEVLKYTRSKKAMFLALDPDIERWEINEDGTKKEGGYDNTPLFQTMLSLGYEHKGWNLAFDGRLPRFTFRIDLSPDEKAIEKSFTGNVLKNVKKSRHYALDIHEGGPEDVPVLIDMLAKTAERDDFHLNKDSYYHDLYRELAKDGMAHLYLGYVDPAGTASMLRQQLDECLEKRLKLKKEGPLRENQETEARLLREIELFDGYAAEYPEKVPVSAHFVVRYGDRAWAIHAGSSGIMNETFCNNRVYYEKLMAQKRAGCVFLDMYGTIGDPVSYPDEQLRSMHAFKRQWGGKYMEFMGEFRLVARPGWYFVYEKVRPTYRHVLQWIRKMKRRLG